VLALVALVAAGFAVNRQQVADSERATAVAEQQRADAQAITAVAERQCADTEAAAAKTQEAIAVTNAQIARTRALASAAISNLAVDPELSVLLASAALSETNGISTTSVPEARGVAAGGSNRARTADSHRRHQRRDAAGL